MKKKLKRRRRADELESIAFQYYEEMRAFIRDLQNIRAMIPAESSRSPLPGMTENGAAIIVARKNDLLAYIQTICEDQIEFGGQLVAKGWTPEQWKRHKSAKPKLRKES